MIKKIYKLKTEDFKKPFKNIHNGAYFNIRVHNNVESDLASRYAVIINKKVDKRAVTRNSLKRQIFKILKDQEIQNPSLTELKETKLYMINVKRMFGKENLEDVQKELINSLV